MADLYANYAALAAAEVEGVDYTRTAVRPRGASWAAIAIHGGGIEAGSGEMARRVSDLRGMSFYEFAGIQAANNFEDLHITGSNFDEPMALSLVGASSRVLSFHGFTGTAGVAETLIGGLDGRLRDAVKAALTAAGFTVTVAASELAGTDTANICNKSARGGGVQLEMSLALRQSFFPGGDTSRAMRDSGQRTATFEAYAQAVASVLLPGLTYDSQLSRVRLSAPAPGLLDTFSRTVTDGWGDAESGQSWIPVGTSTAFQVNGGVGKHVHTGANASRWSLAAVRQADWDFYGSVSTDALAAGGSQFHALAGRSSDDGATCYLARLDFTTAQAVVLTLRKRVAGTETLLTQFTTGLTHAAGVAVRCRFQGVGSTLQAKAWLASGTEPASWQVTTTDTAVTGTGRSGFRSILSSAYSGTYPVTSSWDNLTTVGTAVVERSPDGVRWTAVRGGTGLDGTAGATLKSDDYEFAADTANQYRVRVYEPASGKTLWTTQDSLTPTLGGVWLKSIARPYLNRQVTVVDYSDVQRPGRAGVFDVVGRSFPVSVSDVRGSRRWTMEVLTQTLDDAHDLDLVLASGDPMFVQVPADSGVPAGYVTVGDVNERRTSRLGARRVFELPFVEVAAPGPDVVGATVTCQSVLTTYATCQAVLDAHPTVVDLLELVGDPIDVVVP